MSKTALIPIADGSEEIEAVTIIDVLRRADIDRSPVASVSDDWRIRRSPAPTASRWLPIAAIDDCQYETVFDLVAIPGGLPGAEHLAASATT